MPAFKKMFKDIKNEHILGILGLVVLIFALYKYSENKNIFTLGMTPGPSHLGSSGVNESPSINNIVGASANTFSHTQTLNGATPSDNNSSVAINKPIANPSDLLPNDANSSWTDLNPIGELQNINLLNPTQVVGINTQGSSLRNANLQLRSEPPNPRTNTNCPWNISTIDDDKFRKPLEIGTSA